MCEDHVPTISPRRKPRGGRRAGAGAPTGNLNGLKTGRYSIQLEALQGALDAMPQTARLLEEITKADRRKTEKLAYALRYYSEMLFLKAGRDTINKKANSIKKRGVLINKSDRARIREIMKLAKAIK